MHLLNHPVGGGAREPLARVKARLDQDVLLAGALRAELLEHKGMWHSVKVELLTMTLSLA